MTEALFGVTCGGHRLTDDFLGAAWWHFDRYQVDELYIRPARDARLVAYDPWQANREALTHRRDHEPPYVTLARLGDAFLDGYGRATISGRRGIGRRRSHLPGIDYIDADGKLLAAVQDWCAANGPLGVLLGGLEAFTTAARYRAPDPGPFWRDEARIYPSVRTYELSAGQWRAYETELHEYELGVKWGSAEAAAPERLAPERIERAFRRASLPQLPLLPPPGQALRRAYYAVGELSSWYLEPLSGWWTFFPELAIGEAAFDYPEPLSDEFWHLHAEPPDAAAFDLPSPASEEFWLNYAEPLEQFVKHAIIFAEALAGLQHRWEDILGEGASLPALVKAEPDAPEETFRRLLSFVVPDLLPDPRQPRAFAAQWSSPTLLSTLAFMAFSDLTGGGRIGYCKRNACRRVFLARRPDQEYCSLRCKATAKKAYQRHPERAAEVIALHQQGLSVAKIATDLHLSEKRVAAWIGRAQRSRSVDANPSSSDDHIEQQGGGQ